jgi:hypothetical protein
LFTLLDGFIILSFGNSVLLYEVEIETPFDLNKNGVS